MNGRCMGCGHPFDDHRLPPVLKTTTATIKPICPPPAPYYGKSH